jgi:hypothetical protein
VPFCVPLKPINRAPTPPEAGPFSRATPTALLSSLASVGGLAFAVCFGEERGEILALYPGIMAHKVASTQNVSCVLQKTRLGPAVACRGCDFPPVALMDP